MTEPDRQLHATDARVTGAGEQAEAEVRLRRLRLRSWRRGTREMDLLLGPFADAKLGAMKAEELVRYEALLAESDPDLYAWATGREAPPERHAHLLARIAAHAVRRFAQQSDVP